MQGWDGISGDSKKAYFAKVQWKHFFAFTSHTKYTKEPRDMERYVWTKRETEMFLIVRK